MSEPRRKAYPTDLSDTEWQKLEPLVPGPKEGGRPATYARREIVNGILYVLRGGGSWRMLPHDFPPWEAELTKGGIVLVARDVFANELPQALDQIQVGRVGWQEEQVDAKLTRVVLHLIGTLVASIIEHKQKRASGVDHTQFVEQAPDQSSITRRRFLNRDEGVTVGRIGPKHVETIPATIGLEFDTSIAFDPSVAWYGVMQQKGRIHKVHPSVAFQLPLV